MTHVLRDGEEKTVTDVIEDELERTALRDVLWDGEETTVKYVSSDSTQQLTALNVSRMADGLDNISLENILRLLWFTSRLKDQYVPVWYQVKLNILCTKILLFFSNMPENTFQGFYLGKD